MYLRQKENGVNNSKILLLVYILYLVFQLKSHAYLYESTPQIIIDEESHPGVLADVLGSSSSSDSSETSNSSDSEDSLGSRKTARRIKRAFRRRKPNPNLSQEDTSANSIPGEPLSFGYTEDRQNRDYFEEERSENIASNRNPTRNKTWAKDRDVALHREKRKLEKQLSIVNGKSARKQEQECSISNPDTKHGHLEASGMVTEPEMNSSNNEMGNSRRPFNLRQLSTNIKPTMPEILSNNVFLNASHSIASQKSIEAAAAASNTAMLKRSKSLPGRLNDNNTATGSYIRPCSRHINVEQHVEAEQDLDIDKPLMSRTAAIVMLLVSTGLVAVCAEFLVDVIPEMTAGDSGINEAFVGLIILPVVGNAAEHITAVTVAAKNKMDLAIGVAVGSSIQIGMKSILQPILVSNHLPAIFVTPLVVILGWCMDKPMSLYFNLFETISLFVTVFVVNFLVLDGRSNYLEGALLIAAYTIIA